MPARTLRGGSCNVVAALLAVGLAAEIGIHLLAPRLGITWSYDHLWRDPLRGYLAVLAVPLGPLLSVLLWKWPAMHRPLRPVRRSHRLVATAGLLAVLVFVSVHHPSQPTTIDPPLFVIATNRGDVNPRHLLTTWSLGRLAAMLKPWMSVSTFLLVMSGLYGTITYLALVACARRLGRTRGEALAIALITCSAFGVVQMSFGVDNSRAVALALLSLYCWTAFRVVDGDGHLVWPALIGTMGLFWYEGLMLLLPSLPVLAGGVIRRPDGRRQLTLAAAVAVVASGAATLPVYGAPFAWSAFFADAHKASSCELGVSPTSCMLTPAYIFTAQHALEVLHLGLLIDGVGVLLVGVTGSWLVGRLLARRQWDQTVALLVPILAGVVAFVVTMDNLFGNYANWDVFSYGAAVTGLLGSYAFVTWGRECPVRFHVLFGLALVAAGIHLLARLNAMHLDFQRHDAESPPSVHLEWPEPRVRSKPSPVPH